MTSPLPSPRAAWLRVATRPGSGLGLLPAALSAQPALAVATLLAVTLAALATADLSA
jgi:hypothetical protein